MNKNKIYNVWFSVPALALYVILFISPVILNFGYSLTNWNAVKLTGETGKFSKNLSGSEAFSDYSPDDLVCLCNDYFQEYFRLASGVGTE